MTLAAETPAPTPLPHADPNLLARRLGYAGLIPLVAGALFVWLLVGRIDDEPFAFVVRALSTYAALILSFLGGMRAVTWTQVAQYLNLIVLAGIGAAVVPLVLTEAWRRDVMVFSSALEHVRRGALFSVIPNFADYGYAVADAALRSNQRNELLTLKQFRYIVNTRAAQHLRLSAAEVAAFDVVTPRP